jgi:hypothetical protein
VVADSRDTTIEEDRRRVRRRRNKNGEKERKRLKFGGQPSLT